MVRTYNQHQSNIRFGESAGNHPRRVRKRQTDTDRARLLEPSSFFDPFAESDVRLCDFVSVAHFDADFRTGIFGRVFQRERRGLQHRHDGGDGPRRRWLRCPDQQIDVAVSRLRTDFRIAASPSLQARARNASIRFQLQHWRHTRRLIIRRI